MSSPITTPSKKVTRAKASSSKPATPKTPRDTDSPDNRILANVLRSFDPEAKKVRVTKCRMPTFTVLISNVKLHSDRSAWVRGPHGIHQCAIRRQYLQSAAQGPRFEGRGIHDSGQSKKFCSFNSSVTQLTSLSELYQGHQACKCHQHQSWPCNWAWCQWRQPSIVWRRWCPWQRVVQWRHLQCSGWAVGSTAFFCSASE